VSRSKVLGSTSAWIGWLNVPVNLSRFNEDGNTSAWIDWLKLYPNSSWINDAGNIPSKSGWLKYAPNVSRSKVLGSSFVLIGWLKMYPKDRTSIIGMNGRRSQSFGVYTSTIRTCFNRSMSHPINSRGVHIRRLIMIGENVS